MRGMEADFYWIDEAAEISKRIWRKLRRRTKRQIRTMKKRGIENYITEGFENEYTSREYRTDRTKG